jgi:ATP-binding protein involved in chromosome partitioning
MVTTPQEVALIDVAKAVSMFKKVEIPILGVIENMSYYVCPSCGHHDEIFSRGGGRLLAKEVGTQFLGELPIDAKVRHGGDAGRPVVVGAPASEHAKLFLQIAARVAGEVAKLNGPSGGTGRRAAGLVQIR